jgi:HSP20 family protein
MWRIAMAESTNVPVNKGQQSSSTPSRYGSHPFESFRREMDRLFDDFGRGFFSSSFPRSFFNMAQSGRDEQGWMTAPHVDVAETEKGYEIAAEFPGMDQKNIDVKVANGVLTIKGEKHDEKQEKQKDYYLRERSFGSFQRSFQVPDDVDLDKIECSFKNGLLNVTLPKSPQAQKATKKIEVKST